MSAFDAKKYSDKLVYQYLIEKGYLETAEEFRKKRKKGTVNPIYCGEVTTISKMFQLLINVTWPELFRNYKVTNTVVYNFLKNHERPGIQELAFELQKEVPMLVDEKVPAIQEVYNPSTVTRKVLVAARKKVRVSTVNYKS